jgi:hypothetical protein
MFILFDEDIFTDPDFVRQLGRLIRSDRSTWPLRWAGFGSMRTISQFSPQELRECGLEAVWVGVESGQTGPDRKSRTGYAKRDSDTSPEALFPELLRHGIYVVGSMILGLDFHTPENIEHDIDYFVRLNPALYQIGPMRPCPGTKIYNRLLEAGRINDGYDWEDMHLWEVGSFKHPNLPDDALRRYFDLAHEKLKTINGPPLLQIFEANLRAYQTLKDASTEYLRYQAERSRQIASRLLFIIKSIESETPWPSVKKRAATLLEQACTTLTPKGMGRANAAYNLIASKLASSAHVVGTYGWLMPSADTSELSPTARWVYYHQQEDTAPVAVDPTINKTRTVVKSIWRVINRPAKPTDHDAIPNRLIARVKRKKILTA